MARHGGEFGPHSLPAMPVSRNNGHSSPLDSRIPRLTPSPSALRRSSSLWLRGSNAAGVLSAGAAFQHHHDFFPVIKENGSETPRRSSSSLSLTPSRRRTHPRAGVGHGECNEDCSDAESLKSYGSNYSTASACDHASFARNGTTWSGRSRRYVFHCATHASNNDEYLTPTQRATRQVRELQAMLKRARMEIEEKDREIVHLTKEVVELRLYKASLNSPDEKTDSSEAATIREMKPFSPDSPSRGELLLDDSFVTSPTTSPRRSPITSPRTPDKKESSLVDSGHFEDGSMHSKESTTVAADPASVANESYASTAAGSLSIVHDESIDLLSVSSVRDTSLDDHETKRLVDHYERRIEEMHRRHVDETQLLKQSHNDKVESLLNQLSEVSMRYCQARPSLDAAEARTKELEAELEALRAQVDEQRALLADQEEQNKQMYLKMYSKGQEAARIEQSADQVHEPAQKNPGQVTVAELLQQLAVTKAELENIKPFQDTRIPSSYSPEPLTLANRSQSLLSVHEAVSLWVLGTRKVMYRRIVESKNTNGALDPEIKLQFLKSAIYYFLTDKENLHVHLNVIESILDYTSIEKLNIDRIYGSARK